jgi:hypothetical protein
LKLKAWFGIHNARSEDRCSVPLSYRRLNSVQLL